MYLPAIVKKKVIMNAKIIYNQTPQQSLLPRIVKLIDSGTKITLQHTKHKRSL